MNKKFSNFINNENNIIKNFKINDRKDHLLFANLKLAADNLNVYDSNIIKNCWNRKNEIEKFNNIVDYYHLIFSEIVKNKNIKKTAYPNNSADKIIGLYDKQYDIVMWSQIVKKIYNKYYEMQGQEDYQNIVEEISKEIKDDEERFKFKMWLKYYNDGNNKKYSNNRNYNMKKQSSFFLPLTVGDSYSADRNPYSGGTELDQTNYASDYDKTVNEAKDRAELKTSYKNWKKKFNTAWRRIDKILKESEDFIEPERYEQISEILHKLDVQIGKIRLHSTASDLSFGVANQLKKIGFSEGSDILNKFAQEVAPIEAEPAQTTATQQAVPDGTAPVEAEKTPEQLAAERRSSDRNNEAIGEEIVKAVEPLPGPSAQEYDKLLPGTISIDDASGKLEQIAGMLSDRRVIRYLAEFDIMLDKIGIASMFPELAEAQSKLIDSYSYALVRVTKMLGMLSNNKAILEKTIERPTEEAAAPVRPNPVSAAPTPTTPVQTAPVTPKPIV